MNTKKIVAFFLAVVLSVMILPVSVSARDLGLQTAYAKALKTMHLFKGVSEYDFALGRPATRVEAIVIVIRLLGKEEEALSQYWWHPFTDVPEWADRYVGYAYQMGISMGVSDSEFGTGTVSAEMFVTYCLRVLGYSDANGDFVWSDPYNLAWQVGLFEWEADLDLHDFWRADIVTICMGVLGAYRTDGTDMLNYLYYQGVFTDEEMVAGLNNIDVYYDTLNAPARSGGYSDDEPAIYTVEDNNSGSRTVWITPTGKRWHADPDCGGVNSYPVSLETAERQGLTPCQKCAY